MSKQLTTYQTLLEKHGGPESISYEDLLSTSEWKTKRNEILQRDFFVCQKCKRRKTEKYDTADLLRFLETNKSNQTWKIVGGEQLKSEKLNDGNYWNLHEPQFKKFNAYKGYKYIETRTGRILIQADKPYKLHVHHKIYILNILPWDNFHKDFETLCNWCHLEIHQTEEIQCYRLINNRLIPAKMKPCFRCQGKGKLPEYEHIENGICFRCFGRRFEELIES